VQLNYIKQKRKILVVGASCSLLIYKLNAQQLRLVVERKRSRNNQHETQQIPWFALSLKQTKQKMDKVLQDQDLSKTVLSLRI